MLPGIGGCKFCQCFNCDRWVARDWDEVKKDIIQNVVRRLEYCQQVEMWLQGTVTIYPRYKSDPFADLEDEDDGAVRARDSGIMRPSDGRRRSTAVFC